jgi:hypothetical protein
MAETKQATTPNQMVINPFKKEDRGCAFITLTIFFLMAQLIFFFIVVSNVFKDQYPIYLKLLGESLDDKKTKLTSD